MSSTSERLFFVDGTADLFFRPVPGRRRGRNSSKAVEKFRSWLRNRCTVSEDASKRVQLDRPSVKLEEVVKDNEDAVMKEKELDPGQKATTETGQDPMDPMETEKPEKSEVVADRKEEENVTGKAEQVPPEEAQAQV